MNELIHTIDKDIMKYNKIDERKYINKNKDMFMDLSLKLFILIILITTLHLVFIKLSS